MIGDFLADPDIRRALVGAMAVAISAAPIGVFLTLRRMSLAGDAIAHGILPGAAIGYLIAGLSLTVMTIGGLVAGMVVALAAAAVSRRTIQREDASLGAFYLVSLALGVLLISLGDGIDLETVLFGAIESIERGGLVLLVSIAAITIVGLALIVRPLLIESFDPSFLRRVGGRSMAYYAFLALAVLNLVAGFHAVGTLMALGTMIVPAAAARFWTGNLGSMIGIAMALGAASSFAGLFAAYHADVPAGPAIILAAGLFYLLSLAAGPFGIVRRSGRSIPA